MFLIFLIAVAAALVFMKLGALSVWVGVLSFAIKAILITAIAVVLYIGLMYVWRRYKGHRSSHQSNNQSGQ